MKIGEMIKKHHLLILGGVVVAAAFWYDRNKASASMATNSSTPPAAGSSSFTGYANADSLSGALSAGAAHTTPTLEMLRGMTCDQLTKEYNYWMGQATARPSSAGQAPAGQAPVSNTCTPCYMDLILSVIQSKGCKFTSKDHSSPESMGFTGDVYS